MKVGDLVKLKMEKDNSLGLFLGYKESNGYRYSEVFWFHGKVSSCQSDLLEVIGKDG